MNLPVTPINPTSRNASGMGEWDFSSIDAQALKNVPMGRAVDTVKKIRRELK
jgi:hypothetical protein